MILTNACFYHHFFSFFFWSPLSFFFLLPVGISELTSREQTIYINYSVISSMQQFPNKSESTVTEHVMAIE